MSLKQQQSRDGFSLVEVIVAMLVLSFGLVAMAASTGYVYNQLRSTAFDTQRNLARQAAIEQVRGMFWNNIPTTAVSTTRGRYTVSYVALPSSTSTVKTVRVITSGPAYRAGGKGTRQTVVDTASIQVMKPL
jgi:prepilin-type N-terminal cleavage/methylation domain-containing protein